MQTLLNSELEHRLGYFLTVETHVVLCGTATPENLLSTERPYVHSLKEFLEIASKDGYGDLTASNGVANFFLKSNKPRPNTKASLQIIRHFFLAHM